MMTLTQLMTVNKMKNIKRGSTMKNLKLEMTKNMKIPAVNLTISDNSLET